MYAKSIVAMLAALVTFGFLATSVQAAPPMGLASHAAAADKAVTRVDCKLCELVQGDEDEEDDGDDDEDGVDMLDLVMIGAELL